MFVKFDAHLFKHWTNRRTIKPHFTFMLLSHQHHHHHHFNFRIYFPTLSIYLFIYLLYWYICYECKQMLIIISVKVQINIIHFNALFVYRARIVVVGFKFIILKMVIYKWVTFVSTALSAWRGFFIYLMHFCIGGTYKLIRTQTYLSYFVSVKNIQCLYSMYK